MGSLLYLIFALINRLSFPPVAGAKDSNDTAPIGKADGENAPVNLTKAKVALLSFAVGQVFGNNTAGIGECILGQRKRHPMLFLVFRILVCIPLKPGLVY